MQQKKRQLAIYTGLCLRTLQLADKTNLRLARLADFSYADWSGYIVNA